MESVKDVAAEGGSGFGSGGAAGAGDLGGTVAWGMSGGICDGDGLCGAVDKGSRGLRGCKEMRFG